MGESLGECCAGSALFIFNGVDIVCGVMLTVYALYLGVNGFAPDWLYGPILAVGAVMIFTAALSWCGASYRSCATCLSLSQHLFILLALLELVLAVVILTQGAAINKFLRDHQAQLHLTDDQLRRFENAKFLPAYVLLSLFGMELLRFCCSSEFNRARDRRKYHYQGLRAMRDLDENLLAVKKEQEISTKYAELKDKYKNKYQAPVASTSSTLYV